MKWVFGDCHGCGNELRLLIDGIKKRDKDATIYSVGDLFDRGPEPVLVWNLIREHNIKAVKGNHERKFAQYLNLERSWLPKHYYWCLRQIVESGASVSEFKAYCETLPTIICNPEENWIISHAGVDLSNPRQEDISANIYGKPKLYDEEIIEWWNVYSGKDVVVYGHLSTGSNAIRDKGNSKGIDTSACHGGWLTAYCIETGEIEQVQSIDYWKIWHDKLKNNEVNFEEPIYNDGLWEFQEVESNHC